jgi:ABC-type bacteriocin/lantibiotic exporter with double-glycine peptidase domain
MTSALRRSRTLLAPEVIQSSGMDCGPAALKCLLEGFGIPVSYGRLREACQTDVDGSSIDTLEEVANALGLEAEQVMVPADHVLRPEASLLPAMLVVRLPSGITHFVVVWRQWGGLVQVMDPGAGRRWVPAKRLLQDIYLHSQSVPASDWREWAGSEDFAGVLRSRLKEAGANPEPLLARARNEESWRGLAVLDAACRAAQSMIRAGTLRKGREASRLIERFCACPDLLPPPYWSVQEIPTPAPTNGPETYIPSDAAPREGDVAQPSTQELDDTGETGGSGEEEEGREQIRFRGAALLKVKGNRATAAQRPEPESPDLAAALREPPARPGRELLKLLRADGVVTPGVVGLALLLAAGGVLLEALLFRGLFDMAGELKTSGQRMAAMVALLTFLLLLAVFELPLVSSLLRFGRGLELRLRQAFLDKIPKLGDRYFQSRLKSDMADRSHMLHRVRQMPNLGGQLLRNGFELALTAAGIVWIDPQALWLAVVAAAAALLVPLSLQPAVTERDLRLRSHAAALSRFYLDALLGLVPVRAHGAERAVRNEQRGLLGEWARAGLELQRIAVSMEAAQFILGFSLAGWLLVSHLQRQQEAGAALLLVYWALNLPVIGQEIALISWQYPAYRNITLRLMEPLTAPESGGAEVSSRPAGGEERPAMAAAEAPAVGTAASPTLGASLRLESVTVQASGHAILQEVSLDIVPGTHVAIVGPSGAGKSSLTGILLGWHRAASGEVWVDGEPLTACVERLRRETAWVDPSVQLWNASFLSNLTYGNTLDGRLRLGQVMDAAELRGVVEKLPEGMGTPLGEGGALVSGGEGQRVRLGRALLRPSARLVILDEPFRGLDRRQRREMLVRAREFWRDSTLLCITHDVSETLTFERVLVLESGRIVEDGRPARLALEEGSRFRALLDAERHVQETIWTGDHWRRVRLEGGRVHG